MKTCSNCGQPIQENDMKNAAGILGELQETRQPASLTNRISARPAKKNWACSA